MDFRSVPPVVLGKFINKLTKLTGSGGTALPGLVVETIFPDLLSSLASQIKKGSVLITGTNGKTTTSRILGNILTNSGFSIVHNRSGSNLLRGLLSSLILESNWQGTLGADFGVFEVDEFVFPLAIEKIHTKVVVINNLFRDQLDRYGEIETIRARWEKALKNFDRETLVSLNADDATVAQLGTNLKAKVLYFGLQDEKYILKNPPHASDALKCQSCGNFLYFDYFYLAHMGVYKCKTCRFNRPKLDVAAENIQILGTAGIKFDLRLGKNTIPLQLRLPGLYNVYNTLAAVTSAAALGLSLTEIELGLKDLKPVFGRGEELKVDGKGIYLALVKNPAGFNEVIRLLTADKKKKDFLIIINDLIADGRDVSWLWDVDFENLKEFTRKITVSGFRANDMALRLKHAFGDQNMSFQIEKNIESALRKGLNDLDQGETLYILPTYTAMLQTRKTLEKLTSVEKFWEN